MDQGNERNIPAFNLQQFQEITESYLNRDTPQSFQNLMGRSYVLTNLYQIIPNAPIHTQEKESSSGSSSSNEKKQQERRSKTSCGSRKFNEKVTIFKKEYKKFQIFVFSRSYVNIKPSDLN